MMHKNIMVYAKQEISEILARHKYFFHPHFMENYGLMMLVKNDIEVVASGDVFVHKYQGYIPKEADIGHHARNIQYVTFLHDDSKCTVINFHGLWNGKGKGDSEDRLEQSRKIVAFVKELEGGVILCGDFNLLPDTKSIKILEDAELRNLIKEYGVTSTRTSYYSKPEKFADYILALD
jgi:endonuclease/exonuclease/phosphatase family metal-dependent hydrolase